MDLGENKIILIITNHKSNYEKYYILNITHLQNIIKQLK